MLTQLEKCRRDNKDNKEEFSGKNKSNIMEIKDMVSGQKAILLPRVEGQEKEQM